MAGSHALLQTEVAKALAFGELQTLAAEHVVFERDALDFFFFPMEVRAKQKLAKGDLKLTPATDMGRISAKSGSSSTVVTGETGIKLYLDKPVRPKGPPTDEEPWKRDQLLCAYWWTKSTSDQKEANLVIKKVKVGKFSFPIYENSKVVNAFAKLLVFGPDESPAAKKARR